jgi:hypothetical protein
VYSTFAIPPVAIVIVNHVQVKCLILSLKLRFSFTFSSLSSSTPLSPSFPSPMLFSAIPLAWLSSTVFSKQRCRLSNGFPLSWFGDSICAWLRHFIRCAALESESVEMLSLSFCGLALFRRGRELLIIFTLEPANARVEPRSSIDFQSIYP